MFEDIFGEFSKMQKDMEKLFSKMSNQFKEYAIRDVPADISESNGDVIVKLDMPGVNKNDIDLAVTEDSISVKAKRKDILEENKEGIYRQERVSKGYNFYTELPVRVEPETAEAKYENGVLTVNIKKAEKQKNSKKVKVE